MSENYVKGKYSTSDVLKAKVQTLDKEHNPESVAWKYAPQYLVGNELRYPHLVVDPFFSFYTLSAWREELWQWLDAGLSDYSICECRDAREVLMVCEHLGKLVEAAHLIWIRNWRDDHKDKTT